MCISANKLFIYMHCFFNCVPVSLHVLCRYNVARGSGSVRSLARRQSAPAVTARSSHTLACLGSAGRATELSSVNNKRSLHSPTLSGMLHF